MSFTIITEQLTKQYGDRTAVDHLDLRVGDGRIFGLLGPNGAGKTTTILMLLGLSEPTSGSMSVLGLDPRRDPLGVKRMVGYLPDAVGFYTNLTGRQNLRYTAALNRLDKPESENTIDEVLSEVGLGKDGDRNVEEYSRGMRQRLGIADALLKAPRLLILDEPTAAIDPEGVHEILGLVRSLADDRGVTVLLSSHLLNQVQAICDEVAVFVNGKVVVQGPPHELVGGESGSEIVEVGVGSTVDLSSILAPEAWISATSKTRIPGIWEVTVERGSTARLARTLVDEHLDVTTIKRLAADLDIAYRHYFEKVDADA